MWTNKTFSSVIWYWFLNKKKKYSMTYTNEVSACGFNTGKYELNLMKEQFINVIISGRLMENKKGINICFDGGIIKIPWYGELSGFGSELRWMIYIRHLWYSELCVSIWLVWLSLKTKIYQLITMKVFTFLKVSGISKKRTWKVSHWIQMQRICHDHRHANIYLFIKTIDKLK